MHVEREKYTFKQKNDTIYTPKAHHKFCISLDYYFSIFFVYFLNAKDLRIL